MTMAIHGLLMARAHYSQVGDVTVMALCLVMFVLISQSFVSKDKRFRSMVAMLALTWVASGTDLLIFKIGAVPQEMIAPNHIYFLRVLHYASQTFTLLIHVQYLTEALWLSKETARRHILTTVGLFAAALLVDVIGTVERFGYFIEADGTIHSSFNVYIALYVLLTGTIFYMLIRYRSRIIKQVFWGLFGTDLLSVVLLVIQVWHGESSYTGVSYFLPIIALFFIFHANPYDLDTGAVSEQYFCGEMAHAAEHGTTMVLMSCKMQDFNNAVRESQSLRYEYYQFFRQNVRKGVLYLFPDDRLVLAFPKAFTSEQDRVVDKMVEDFLVSWSRFHIDYKITILETTSEIASVSDYIGLMSFSEAQFPGNSVHRINGDDIARYYRSAYILSELRDIAARKDLDDERVLVYCQPVRNIKAGCYDTAEALMRLKLPKAGVVPPDVFIPIAEQNGLIHALSFIMLNKTCGAIRTLLEEGYELERVSVNFSTMDVRYDDFCQEVQQVIARNQIPFEKVAIEITESRIDSDFGIIKRKIAELRALGIKFYLDDFGTGYSNFERIMGLPFDIIKFDRSMLIESGKTETSFYMVSTFANMFDRLHYTVLFEGVETEADEKSCIAMCAKYLQGFKYSRPIPIEELRDFLHRRSVR